MANECKDVLTREMQAINVDFKFFEEYNQLAEKNRDKVDQSSSALKMLVHHLLQKVKT